MGLARVVADTIAARDNGTDARDKPLSAKGGEDDATHRDHVDGAVGETATGDPAVPDDSAVFDWEALEHKVFVDDSVLAEVGSDVSVLLAGGRVLLLVLARPEIAEAMTTFGSVRSDPYRRLVSTIQATYTLGFGTEDEVRALARYLRRVHRPIRGRNWHASDPDLMFYAYACLLHTSADVFQRFVRDLRADELDAYYEAAISRCDALGIAREAPPDWPAFEKWFEQELRMTRVTSEASALRWQILYPGRPGALRGVAWLWRYLAVSGLPHHLRDEYGIHLTISEEHRLHRLAQRSRLAHTRFPGLFWDMGLDIFGGTDVLYSPPTENRRPLSSWVIATRAARSLGHRVGELVADVASSKLGAPSRREPAFNPRQEV